MKNQTDVYEKFLYVKGKNLKERKQEFLCKSCRNCQHNERVRVKGCSMVGVCQNPAILDSKKVKCFICNEDNVSEKCTFFACKNTVNSVEQDFEAVLKSPARCGQEYPKLAVLIWCLQKEGSQLSILKESFTRKNVWQRIRLWLKNNPLRIRGYV